MDFTGIYFKIPFGTHTAQYLANIYCRNIFRPRCGRVILRRPHVHASEEAYRSRRSSSLILCLCIPKSSSAPKNTNFEKSRDCSEVRYSLKTDGMKAAQARLMCCPAGRGFGVQGLGCTSGIPSLCGRLGHMHCGHRQSWGWALQGRFGLGYARDSTLGYSSHSARGETLDRALQERGCALWEEHILLTFHSESEEMG